MDIQKPHPARIEDERDFDCPKCGNPLSDKTEREHWDYDEKQEIKCPYCGEALAIARTFRIEYKVTAR